MLRHISKTNVVRCTSVPCRKGVYPGAAKRSRECTDAALALLSEGFRPPNSAFLRLPDHRGAIDRDEVAGGERSYGLATEKPGTGIHSSR